MVGRISPIRHIDLALEAVNKLVSQGVQVSLSIVGSPLIRDYKYYEILKKYVNDHNLSTCVHFIDAVEINKLPEIYSNHEVCLNLTDAGSFDKTIVEAASCGVIPLVSNNSLSDLLPKACITEVDPEIIAHSIQEAFDAHQRVEIQNELTKFVKSNSLDTLINKLFMELQYKQ